MSSDRDPVGRKVSHFRVHECIGRGGMGVVYRAEDTRLGRQVALKFLPVELVRDSAARRRFQREAKAASELDDPNICTVHEIDQTEGGQLFIVMGYCQGETLDRRLARGDLDSHKAVDIVKQVLAGLAAAHEHGIVHRDIKPSNLMITPDDRVKILDFGLAKFVGAAPLTLSSGMAGTVFYMAPEQLEGGEVDTRADIFSLGVVFYQLLSGQLPFKGDGPVEVMRAILDEKPAPLDSHSELWPILETALEKDRKKRFQTPRAMLSALEVPRIRPLDETWTYPDPTPRETIPRLIESRWSRPRTLLVALLAVLVLGLGFVLRQTRSEGGATAASSIESVEARKLFEQAQTYEQQGYLLVKLESAERLYRKALEIDPESAVVKASLAALLARLQRAYPAEGRAQEIARLSSEALAADSELALAWYARAVIALIEGDSAVAEESARRTTELASEDFRGRMVLGEALIAQGRVEDGLAELREAVRLGRGYVVARETLGVSLLDLGRYREAATEFETVLEYAPDSPAALSNLAVTYLYQGRYSEAIPLLNQLQRLQPEDDIAASNLGFAYFSLDRMEEAVEAYRRADRLNPDNPNTLHSLADSYEKMGDAVAAREWFEKALIAYDRDLGAGGPRAYLLGQRALCSAKLGRFDQAIENLETAFELAPSQTELLFLAARVYALAGQDEETFEYTRQALAAGISRDRFRTDLSFSSYEEDLRFREILEFEIPAPS